MSLFSPSPTVTRPFPRSSWSPRTRGTKRTPASTWKSPRTEPDRRSRSPEPFWLNTPATSLRLLRCFRLTRRSRMQGRSNGNIQKTQRKTGFWLDLKDFWEASCPTWIALIRLIGPLLALPGIFCGLKPLKRLSGKESACKRFREHRKTRRTMFPL